QMMNRIDQAYQRQREFTGTASHELRTPLARIITQLENVLQTRKINPEVEAVLKSISEDIYQLSDIVSSLLLLSEMDNKGESKFFQSIRLDELLFLSASQLSKLYPDFKLYFEIENGTSRDLNLEILGDETLLKIALVNLLKNAYLYSDHQTVNCVLRQEEKFVELRITNQGAVPQIEDTDLLFQTFRRGTNVRQQVGSGVGLSIVRRILQYHDARVQYQIPDNRTNMLIVTFPQDFKS
ncbi:MAG TPA: ATP-binding protein, partial [Flavisolibacter sp.]|nr:ATP-binding protein [Flavisolibacter sp.]